MYPIETVVPVINEGFDCVWRLDTSGRAMSEKGATRIFWLLSRIPWAEIAVAEYSASWRMRGKVCEVAGSPVSMDYTIAQVTATRGRSARQLPLRDGSLNLGMGVTWTSKFALLIFQFFSDPLVEREELHHCELR